MSTNENDEVRRPLLTMTDWTRGRASGQLNEDFRPVGPWGFHSIDLYRAGYAYGALERSMVLTQLTILFTARPWQLSEELRRLGGIHLAEEELYRQGIEETITKHLALLWPEASRMG